MHVNCLSSWLRGPQSSDAGAIWRNALNWLDGLWAIAEGAVFEEDFDANVHVIDDFEPPSDWPIITCYDPGYDTTAVEWMAGAPDA